MTNPKEKEPADRRYAVAYWKTYYGILGEDTGKILKGLLSKSKEEEPDWVQFDGALRERFGWVADVIRDEAEKRARKEGETVHESGEKPPTARRGRG